MRAKLFVTNADHQQAHASWIRDGLMAHGWKIEHPCKDDDVEADMIVIWGWRKHAAIAAARGQNIPVLVMERGHLQPRMEWTSMGFNGLGGHALYAHPADGGERFEKHFGHQMKPWREKGSYVLVMGQMEGDASLHGQNFMAWAREACAEYQDAGERVVFRPHPNAFQTNHPDGVAVHRHMPLEHSFKDAKLCVTFTSTSGVEAVLSGIPTVACNRGSMAWPMAGHGLLAPAPKLDRAEWATRLSWTQFTPEEIKSGFAWEHLAPVMSTAC